ncbi:MAG: acyltransferase [Alphaproteobacteria bacterium]|nr:acyltransferase [Alphaproteobacteria bacterium]MBL6936667.1 acyltransferase [Alphaproteobacteria bacterium]MBL7097436.1 acyltransferase [Alphaproteobacteria bacterium]
MRSLAMPNSSSATRFRALDGWRGVCALLVVLHHIEIHGWIYWQPLVRNGWLFVDFFFVLSGFVIAHSYGDRLVDGGRIKDFVIRRLGRLWPLHLIMLCAMIALELARLVTQHGHPISGQLAAPFTGDRSPFAILTNLFLVQAMGMHDFETWNGPAWSISCEFYTYLVFAAVCFFTVSRRLRVVFSALFALLGLLVLARFSDYGMRETFHWAIFRCFFGFFVGVLTYEAWRAGVWRWFAGKTAMEIGTLAVVALFVTVVPGRTALEYLATPLFALAVLVFANESGGVSRALTAAPSAALGRWSYSIYLVHTFVIASLFSVMHVLEMKLHRAWLIHLPDGRAVIDMGSTVPNDMMMLAFALSAVALSAVTYRFVELPGQALFARLLRPARTPAAAPQNGRFSTT